MTKPSGIVVARVAALLSLALSGCVTWTGPIGQAGKSGNQQVQLPSEQFSPLIRGTQNAASASHRALPAQSPVQTPSVEMPREAPPRVEPPTVIRGQQPDRDDQYLDRSFAEGRYAEERYGREPLPVSGAPAMPRAGAEPDRFDSSAYSTPPPSQRTWGSESPTYDSAVTPAQYGAPAQYGPPAGYGDAYDVGPYGGAPPTVANPYGPPGTVPGNIGYANPAFPPGPEFQPGPTDMPGQQPFTGRYADLIVNVREQQTGRFMFGVGVNSDAGLTAQVVIDEYNFDWRRFPRSVDEIVNGTAWRGGGQRLRIEAIPGSQLQRYLVNFTEPYLFDTNISLNLSGFLYDRRYFDWDEQRLGGRIGLGYRLTPDLSLTTGLRMENVNIRDPRVRGVSELEEVLGDNSLFSGRVALTHDTRDSPFAATEGHFLEIAYEQTFGSFDYPRGNVDYRRYFLLHERPDGSGRHVLGTSLNTGISGGQTPVYENFFAGGYSTIRGFRFRSANPKSGDVYVGGELSVLGSVEYMFPITADDMLKGVVFCDYGTIEEEINIEWDDFRVALGAGLRISIPAMGPAPIAVDFAVPVAREDTDRVQNFSFFVGFGR